MRDPKVLAIYQGVGTHDPAWDDFEAFKAWSIDNGYADNLSLDRIDYEGGYWPDNCRWATNRVQSRNKSNNVRLTLMGEEMVLADAVKRFGVDGKTIQKRLAAGWPEELAVKRMGSRTAHKLYQKYA